MSHPVFKKKLLASCVAAACSASLSMAAQAQDNVDEEVVVYGIRGALEQAINIKRDAVGVVDAISAEDIGKFPDTNLAESLQRITGVSIDRRNGEGYQVTVRGFGPQFNLVTLNGRSMPTSNLNLGKSSGSNPSAARSFDMSNLAAEGVSGVEVYKTSRADISSGGIGATVNLKTRRPFDNDEGLTATVGGKLLNDTTTRVGDSATPELSTFVSWHNDTFGASLAYTTQERHSAQTGVFTNSWSDRSGPWTDATMIQSVGAAGDVDVINEPVPDNPATPNVNEGQQTNLTPGIRYYHEDQERTRDNSQITLQFRPSDSITATLDVTHAEQELFLNGAEFSFWFGGGTFPASDVQFDGNTSVATPVYFWAENPSGEVRDIGVTQNYGDVINELDSTGLNVEFVASDNLSFELDFHSSEASSLPNDDDTIGSYFNIAIGAQGVWSQGYDNSGDLPLLIGNFAARTDSSPGPDGIAGTGDDVPLSTGNSNGFDVGDLGSTVRQGWFSRAWNEIDQVRLDGDLKLSDTLSLDFGIETRSLEAIQRASFIQETLQGNWGVGTPGDVPADMVSTLNFASLFDGYRTSLTADGQNFFDGAGINDGTPSGATADVFTQGYIANNVKALGKLLSANGNREWAPSVDDTTFRTIKEDVTAFYIQGNYQMELGGKPLDVVLGVRQESTDVESIGKVAPVTFSWQGDNDFAAIGGSTSDADEQRGTADYSHTLPSLSLSLSLTEDLIARFGYSKTIARPSYNNQLLGIAGVQPPSGGPSILTRDNNGDGIPDVDGAGIPVGIPGNPGNAQNGNPALQPLESDNIDLSLEWYFGESSYASIGYFQKDVPNFIGTEVEDQEVLTTDGVATTFDPSNGPRAEAAIAQLILDGTPITQQSLFQMMASQGVEGDGCDTTHAQPGENAGNSADCGDAYASFGYQGADGWEDNIDLSARTGDPIYIARVNSPIDTQAAKLDGWELALQHFFGETGFGMQFNYTIVDGDIGFDITGEPGVTQFALTGLSDTYNIVGIYEDSGWSARLAYNWRDAFLVSATDANNEPRFTEEYTQLDLSVGYDISDDLTVSFEGINLTGEDTRDYGRIERQLLGLNILGPRYAVGARYTFN